MSSNCLRENRRKLKKKKHMKFSLHAIFIKFGIWGAQLNCGNKKKSAIFGIILPFPKKTNIGTPKKTQNRNSLSHRA